MKGIFPLIGLLYAMIDVFECAGTVASFEYAKSLVSLNPYKELIVNILIYKYQIDHHSIIKNLLFQKVELTTEERLIKSLFDFVSLAFFLEQQRLLTSIQI